MTRYELEKWCEKFLQEIIDSAKPYTDLMVKAIREEWDEDQLADELEKMFGEEMTPSYNDRAKQLADFIEQFAKEMTSRNSS